MCRMCESGKCYEFETKVVPAYYKAKEALKAYEKALLEIGADKAHKDIIRLRKKFNKQFNSWEN